MRVALLKDGKVVKRLHQDDGVEIDKDALKRRAPDVEFDDVQVIDEAADLQARKDGWDAVVDNRNKWAESTEGKKVLAFRKMKREQKAKELKKEFDAFETLAED